ncbi:MAG: hypothetical protein ABI777_01125 [Betaproteobacteria bacterium]
MRIEILGSLAIAVTLGVALPAIAAPCFLVIDRNDVVLYRDTVPPFDLSNDQSAARTALRERGHLLLQADFENCNGVGYISQSTGGTTASVDEIVMQLKPAIATSIGASSGGATAGSDAVRAATQPGAGAAATSSNRSSGSSSQSTRR